MPEKRGRKTGIILYFMLLALLLGMLAINAFKLYPLETGTFTRYLIGLIFVLMILPLVPKIKIFDVVDIKREARMFRTDRKK